uniref:uncharacterized protein LOC120338917 n=1 Tax=Styela clava TaxID=7725 RepID=UPI00193962FC|nr:uncharacterized protein LOC120338917 [Styela clava]
MTKLPLVTNQIPKFIRFLISGKENDISMEDFCENFLQETGKESDKLMEDICENILDETKAEYDYFIPSSSDSLLVSPQEEKKRKRKKLRKNATGQKGLSK